MLLLHVHVWYSVTVSLHACLFALKLVQDTLKDHAKFVCNPPVINPVSVTSHRTHYSTNNVWKKIYGNPDLYKE